MVYTIISVWYFLSSLLRKAAITTTVYFPAEEESVCITKKVNVNSSDHDLMQAFCSTHSNFHMEKTEIELIRMVLPIQYY